MTAEAAAKPNPLDLAYQTALENEALKRDLAMVNHSLVTLYEIREALGFNKYFPLSHLASKARRLRQLYLEKGGSDNDF